MNSPYQPYPQGQPRGYGQASAPGGGWDFGQRTYLQGAPVDGPVEAITQGFKHMFTYTGRASESAFWWVYLTGVVISAIFRGLHGNPAIALIGSIISIAFFLASLAAAARRLHDTDRTALWLFLIAFIIIGWIWLLAYYRDSGTPGPNKYDR